MIWIRRSEGVSLVVTTALVNGRVITPLRVLNDGVVVVRDGIIADVGDVNQVRLPAHAEVIDVQGSYVGPGFIDLHVHGF